MLPAGFSPRIKETMFSATTRACARPGRAALCAPLSAMSPAANKLGYLGSWNCSVGRTLMKPFFGFVMDDSEDCRP